MLLISDQLESTGCKLFASLDQNADVSSSDGEGGSATTLIIRTFILSQHERMQKLLLLWARNGLPVGAHLLSYAFRLSCEAYMAGCATDGMIDNNFAEVSESGMPLVVFHTGGLCSDLNGTKQKICGTSSRMEKEFITKLVEDAFAAYKHFLFGSKGILHEEDNTSLPKLLLSDIIYCSSLEKGKIKHLFFSVFSHLADLCTSEGEIIRFLVSQLDYMDLVELQFAIGSNKFCVCGENCEAILDLMKKSLSWDSTEQHKFWALIRSELAISKVQVEKIILEFFWSGELDATSGAIAVGGLLTLCNCRAPTPELVGAIMLLPNNVFQEFSATALASWKVSNSSMLLDSLTTFIEKLHKKSGDDARPAEVTMNHSAVLWLLNHFSPQGMNASNVLSTFSHNIQGEKKAQPS